MSEQKINSVSQEEEEIPQTKQVWPQRQLPIFSKDMVLINNKLGVKQEEDSIYYFNGCMPIFSHHKDDYKSFRMITAQLYVNGNATQMEIVRTFGISVVSVKRAVKTYRTLGVEGFYKKRAQRSSTVFTKDVLKEAQDLLDSGESAKEVASQLGIKLDTFLKACREGRLHLIDVKKKRA